MASYLAGKESTKKNGEEIKSILDIECSPETIYVFPGTLSQNDIVLKYRVNNSRRRTPKHIHFTIDLLIKKEHTPDLVNSFISTLLERWNNIQGLTSRNYDSILNNLIISRDEKILQQYSDMNNYGNYSVEFLLHFGELLMLQEKTNRPDAYMFSNVLNSILKNKDIYSIVSASTHNGK